MYNKNTEYRAQHDIIIHIYIYIYWRAVVLTRYTLYGGGGGVVAVTRRFLSKTAAAAAAQN